MLIRTLHGIGHGSGLLDALAAVWQADGGFAVGGHGDGEDDFPVLLFPAAFDGSVDTVVACFGIVQVPAGPGRDHEAVLPFHLDAAAGVKQPFAHSALGIVVQAGNARIAFWPLPGFPDGHGSALGHGQPAGDFLVFQQAVGVFDIHVR